MCILRGKIAMSASPSSPSAPVSGLHSSSQPPISISSPPSTTTPIITTTRPSSPLHIPPTPARSPLVPSLPNLAREALERFKGKREASPDDSDFKPNKKRRVGETSNNEDICDEEQTCSICFSPWSNSGNHRIASLCCGHLFGLICIEKWLTNAGPEGGKCPQCNFKAKKKDIRVIYAKAISVVDTTERDRALRDLEEEKELRIQARRDEAQALLQQNLARSECDRLKEEIKTLKLQLESYSSSSSSSSSSSTLLSSDRKEGLPVRVCHRHQQGKYSLLKNLSISKTGQARVLAHDSNRSMIVISKSSSNSLLPGYGVSKVSTVDLRHSEYVGIHSPAGTIRDMSFRPNGDGMLLTVATDKTAKLTSVHSNAVVQSFELPSPVWACAWDEGDPVYMYCGLQNGSIVYYDIRVPSKPAGVLTRPPDAVKCPITSLASVPKNLSSSLKCAGLMMGSLGGCVFWEKSNSSSTNWIPHILNSLPEGSCPSVSFEPSTRHFFSSFRPTKRSPRGKHVLFRLHNVPTDKPLSCQPIQQFPGGSTHRLLSRSKLFLCPGSEDKLLAIYGEESTKTVHIWDTSSTLKLQEVPLVQEPALDMLPFGGDADKDFLAVLTQSKLHLHQWQWT